MRFFNKNPFQKGSRIFPESIRWSITTGRKKTAAEMIKRALVMNRVDDDAEQLVEQEAVRTVVFLNFKQRSVF